MYDLIGVGFGPSNLALTIALEEEFGRGALDSRVLFLEKQPTIQWHPGLMLPEATLQVSFLKDLVTLRNPTSRHTFVNYLKEQGRLDAFANLRTFFPSRAEFGRYVKWVGDHFSTLVRYQAAVKAVTPLRDPPGGPVVALRVETQSGQKYECRNLVAATGGTPAIPRVFAPLLGQHVFHSSRYLVDVPLAEDLRGATVAVVGSGQSAGEILTHLLRHAPDVNVVSIIRDFALRPMDDSKFVNEVFMPEMVDFTYGLEKRRREEFLDSVKQSNYSAVDMDLIDDLYRYVYEERVSGRSRLRFMPHTVIDSVCAEDEDIVIRWRSRMTQERADIRAQYVVLATGFEHARTPDYMRPLVRFMAQQEGHPLLRRDYRIECRDGFLPHLYLQGFAEPTHGIADTLLSMAAHRAGLIASQLAQRMNGGHGSEEALLAALNAVPAGDGITALGNGDTNHREESDARHSVGSQ